MELTEKEYALWLKILKWIREEFLVPFKEYSGYLEIELKNGLPQNFTIRVNPPIDNVSWRGIK